MSKVSSARFTVCSVALCAVIGGGFASTSKSQPNTITPHSVHRATDPSQAMVSALAASRPHPSLANEAHAFDPLVGTWDAEFSFHLDDGRVTHKQGELLFGWVMDGRAIQDLWIGFPAEQQRERTMGTSIRFFDTKLNQWRVVFVNPQFNYVVTTQGGLEGDRIVLRGLDSDGLPIRWTFSEMKPDSFHWQGEKSRDGGKTWKLEEDHHMKRQQQTTRSGAAFKQLSSLVGDWEGVQDGVPIKVTYSLTANGTALMEEQKPGDSAPMVTMFTVDGDHLIATHYCVTGNQPQMVSGVPGDLQKGVTFSLARVTGMKTPADWHNTGLTVMLDDIDHITQRWTYLYKGKTGATTFHYTRKK